MTNEDRCPVCDGMLALIGRVHHCVPRVIASKLVPDKAKAEPELPAQSATYRYRDPEKWRAYMRGYMQRKRAKNSMKV